VGLGDELMIKLMKRHGLITVKQINKWTIMKRYGPPIRNLPLYSVWKDGVCLEEFRRLASARRWCKDNWLGNCKYSPVWGALKEQPDNDIHV
jgi:hypothetical protein